LKENGQTGREWRLLGNIRQILNLEALSVGFVLEDANNYVTLVQSVSAERTLGRITISREATNKIRRRL